MKNKKLFLSIFIVLLLGVAGCSTIKTEDLPKFTLTQLAEFDGIDGAKAYVAVDGFIYDVSAIPEWSGGEHYDGAMAGVDLSELINQAPHGKSMLSRAKLVGTLSK